MSDDQTGIPAQRQDYPGQTGAMTPPPRDEMADYRGTSQLEGRVALVTGGDSGIGRAVSVAFAKEGADVAVAYLCEDADAEHTAELIEAAGRRAVLIRGDLGTEDACRTAVRRTVDSLGHLDLLVNNVAYQEPKGSLEEITTELSCTPSTRLSVSRITTINAAARPMSIARRGIAARRWPSQ